MAASESSAYHGGIQETKTERAGGISTIMSDILRPVPGIYQRPGESMRSCMYPGTLFFLPMTSIMHPFALKKKIEEPYAILNVKEFDFL